MALRTVLFLCSCFLAANSKVYKRCDLARELRDVHEIPEKQLATWICIANYESHFNTSAHNPGSGDHGLFQISEMFWCSPPGNGLACGVSCADLKDDDIEDDVICARRIYRQHQRLTGDGFNAWVVYNLHCKNEDHVNCFIKGCDLKTKKVNSIESSSQKTPKVDEESPSPKSASSTTESTPSKHKESTTLKLNDIENPKSSVQAKRSDGATKSPITLLIISQDPDTSPREKKVKSARKSSELDQSSTNIIPISVVSQHTNFKPAIHLLN